MAQIRGVQHNPSFQKEVAFNVKNGSFSSLRRFLGVWGWEPGQFKQGTIANEVVRADLGTNEPGVGLWSDNTTMTFNCYPQGVGVVSGTLGAGDGETPVPNAFTYLLEASLGGTAVVNNGGTVASTASVTSVTETASGNHATGGILCVEDVRSGAQYTGRAVCRPIGAYATATMTLLMGLPSALQSAMASGDVIYGGITIKQTEVPTVTLQGDWLGYRASHNFEFFGAVFNFSIGEVDNGAAPVFAFEGKVASASRNVGTSRTSVNSLRPTVLAGGEFLLAKYGNATATELPVLKFGFNLAREYKRQSGQNNDGISGWVLTNQQTSLTLYVEDNATVPAGFSGSTYFDLFASGDAENQFHYFVTLGNRFPGRIVNMYLPHIHMSAEPEHSNMDEIGHLKLMFELSQGDNNITMAQH